MPLRFSRTAVFGLLSVWLTMAPCTTAGLAKLDGGKPDPKATAAAERPSPGPLMLQDRVLPLVPKQPPSEVDEDRSEALSLFSAGRMAERRKDYARALRFYQRALRYDPRAILTARGVIRLALRLNRKAELFRYALKVVELEDTDAAVIQGLAAELVRRGDFDRAIKLYEKTLTAAEPDEDSADNLALRMDLGQLHYLLGDYREAADNFTRVLKVLKDPEKHGLNEDVQKALLGDAAKAYAMFAETFLLADQPEVAVDLFKQADQISPNKGLLGCNMARVYARTDRPDEALVSLQDYFDQHLADEGTAPYQLLSEILKKLDKEDELLGRLEKLLGEDPDNRPLGYSLATQYYQAEQFDKAEPIYSALATKAHSAAGYRGLANVYRKTNRPEKLLEMLGTVVEKSDSLGSLGAEGRAILADDGLLETLIETTRGQLKADPESVGHPQRLALALLAMEAEKYGSAGEFFDLAIEARPEQAADLLLVWGVGLLVADKYADAAAVFQRGIDQEVPPEHRPDFHSYLATVLEMEGRTDEALAAAGKAVGLAEQAAQQASQAAKKPADEADKLETTALAAKAADLTENLLHYKSRVAWILYHSRQYEQAARAYDELIEEFDSDYSSTAVRFAMREARLMLSSLCVLGRDIPQAEEWLQQVLDEFPDDVSALNDLGYLWADENKHINRAHAMIKRALEEEPDNEAYLDSLGWVLFRMGRPEEALVEMQKAAAGDKPDPVILDHLGDIYHDLNQPEKAKDAWRRAAESFSKDGKSEEAERVEKKLKG